MPAVSLFTETVNKVAALETELAAAHERIRNLEIALKAARSDKMRAVGAAGYTTRNATTGTPAHDLNTLSEDDVQELFRQHKTENVPQTKKWWQFFHG